MNEPLTNTEAPAPPPAVTPSAPPVAYVPVVPQIKSPAIAGLLSVPLPGLGHVYLGLYKRGAIFLGICMLIIAVVSEVGGPLGMAIPFWWAFVVIDAVRSAQAINRSGRPDSSVPEDFQVPTGSFGLALGVFFILFGLFFTLRNFVHIDLSFLRDWWPLLFVAFGLWQVFAYLKEKQDAVRKSDPTV